MTKEYGGYLPLELKKNGHYYRETDEYNCVALNSGRSAIIASLAKKNVNKVYIPYYNCQMVEDALVSNGYKVEKYYLDKDFYPSIDSKSLTSEDYLLYNCYFGVDFSLWGGIFQKLSWI